jgi:hypothetical protein
MKSISKATSARRLLKLAAFLEKLPDNRFDYGLWVGPNWKGDADFLCGTTACALGWATTMPEFRSLGLVMDRVRVVKDEKTGKYGHQAAVRVFGLTANESDYLFTPRKPLYGDLSDFSCSLPIVDKNLSPSSGATPRDVAYHIRRFVHLYRKIDK